MRKHPIVLLHGWGLSGQRFSPAKKLLERQGFTVFTPDFPGFHTDPADSTVRTLDDYVTFLRDYLTEHGITYPVLVGHSFGGRVIIKYAKMYPKSVRAIILSGTPGYRTPKTWKRYLFTVLAKCGKVLFLVPGLSHLRDKAAGTLYAAAGARDFTRANQALRQTFKHVVEEELESGMRSIRVPTLLLWGERDQLVPVAIAAKMQTVIAGSQLQIVNGYGHALPYDQPEEFTGRVCRFLEELA